MVPPGVTVADIGDWKLLFASRCSLRSAVVEVPSMIIWIRTGPPVNGGVPPDFAIRLKTRLFVTLLGTMAPLQLLIMAGPP